MKTKTTVFESNIDANAIRDTIGLMEGNTPDDALHFAEQLQEEVEEFISKIKQLTEKETE